MASSHDTATCIYALKQDETVLGSPLTILDFTSADAIAYATVRAKLERSVRQPGRSTHSSRRRPSPADRHSSR